MKRRLLIPMLLATSIQAAMTPAPGEVTTLPVVTVTAPNESSPVPRAPGQLRAEARRVAGGVAVVGREELAPGRDARFADWLRFVPGVALSSDNAADVSKISMRGSGLQSDEALGVQVLLDGLTYNQGDGEANLEEIDLAAVAAAEVFRGANALRYGGYALGGAINLVAVTGRDQPGLTVEAQAGSCGFRRAHLGAGYARGRNDGYIAFAAREADGFRAHSAEHGEVFSGNFGRQFGAGTENRFYWGLSQWRREVPGDLTLAGLSADPHQADPEALEGDFRTFTRSLRVADKFTLLRGPQRLEAGAFYHYRRFLLHDLYERDYRLGVTDADSDNLGLAVTLQRTVTLFGRAHTFTAGLAPAHETERSENFRNDDGVIDRTRRTAAGVTRGLNFPVFAEGNLAVTDRLAVIAGAQFVHVDRDFDDHFLADDGGDQSNRQKFDSFNPRFGLTYAVPPGGQFFANVARGFQPPSFDDLTPFASGRNGSVSYTPLAAQRAWTVEAGYRGEFAGGGWDFGLYHSRERDELLELNDASGHELGTVNAPQTRHQGIELGVELELSAGLALRQEYTLSDFRFSADPVYGGNRLGGAPAHHYEAELTWRRPGGFSLGANLQGDFGKRYGDHANSLRIPGQILLGLNAAYRPRGGGSLFIEVRNLADRRSVAMVKPIADGRTAAGEDLRVFAPGAPRSFTVGGAWSW